jgi:tripartite-type tricarboxylate transporter receptor subunit TctC
MQRRKLLLLTALAPFMGVARGQDAYPSRGVRIVSPFAVGGIADTFSRIIAAQMQRDWGQSAVVENRTGAGGNIGADFVAKAVPDGYTLVMGNNGTNAINVSLFPSLSFDPIRDFTPIVRVVDAEGVLVVNPELPVKNVQDLIDLARKDPGKLVYASGGLGTTSHLAGELFKSLAKVDITHVPYKGNFEAINDLLAGRTQLSFATLPTVLPFVRAGKLRAIATIEARRSVALPELPTVAESGVPGFDVKNWIGLFGPAGLPKPIVDKVNAEVIRTMQMPDVQPQLTTAGARFAPNTPADFAKFIRDEKDLWAGIIKNANIHL